MVMVSDQYFVEHRKERFIQTQNLDISFEANKIFMYNFIAQ